MYNINDINMFTQNNLWTYKKIIKIIKKIIIKITKKIKS